MEKSFQVISKEKLQENDVLGKLSLFTFKTFYRLLMIMNLTKTTNYKYKNNFINHCQKY